MLGLQQSLTPSRNNGFLNMFRLMQKKTLELASSTMKEQEQGQQGAGAEQERAASNEASSSSGSSGNGSGNGSGSGARPQSATPVQDGIRTKLSAALQPTRQARRALARTHRPGHRPTLVASCVWMLYAPSPCTVCLHRSAHTRACARRLTIIDDSASHSGHAAMMAAPGKAGSSGETHFKVEVVSPEFEGLSLVKRHRMVNQVRDEGVAHGFRP